MPGPTWIPDLTWIVVAFLTAPPASFLAGAVPPPPGLGPLVHEVVAWALDRPWLAGVAVAAVVVWLVADGLVAAWRQRRMARGAALVKIIVPPVVEPAGAHQFWTTVYGATYRVWWRRAVGGTPHLAFEYRWTGRVLTIGVWVPGTVAVRTVATAATAAWPAATVTITAADPPLPTTISAARGGALLPIRSEAFPLRTEYDADPLRQILAAGAGLRDHEHACLQILARPASPTRVARLRRSGDSTRDRSGLGAPGVLVRELLDLATRAPSTRRTTRPAAAAAGTGRVAERESRAVLDKAVAGPHWEASIRYTAATASTRGSTSHALRVRLSGIAAGLAGAHAVHTGVNRLRRVRLHDPARVLAARRLRRGFVLSTPELAALAGLPTDVAVPGLTRAGAKAVPAPVQVPTGGRNTLVLGRAQVGGHSVALPMSDARHHLHVLGATGSGKSTLLLHLALQRIRAGAGLIVVEPKGDLINDILARLRPADADRLILLDPAQDPPPAFNPLLGADPALVADNLVSIFAKIFAQHWGPRMDDIFRMALLTILRHPNPMLTTVPPLLQNKQVRAEMTYDLHDPAGLGGFWTWYDSLPPAVRAQAAGPVLGRLRQLLTRGFIRTVVGQPRSSFDMNQVLDGGILLARLPKGVLGDETAKLLGSLVLASAWQAASARADRPEASRRDAMLIIDECQNFLNLPRSIDEIAAEARGYRLSLVLAHQDLTQLPRETVAAISANARNKIVFNCSPEDARILARHTYPELDEHDLSHLDRYTAAARLVIDAAETPAFTLATNPPPDPTGTISEIRARCAQATRARLPAPTRLTDALVADLDGGQADNRARTHRRPSS
ncbi:MAG: hypothetical protein QG597_4645 [Actinomycetota bacterium]|nr:hypothetical protein [Actinomycetota bacterium]